MKKVIEISEEAWALLESGKYVVGSLHKQTEFKKCKTIVFNMYHRMSRRKKDRLIRELENGWIRESPKCYKFYSSVKKALGFRLVNVAMTRDLKDAMNALEVEDLLSKV